MVVSGVASSALLSPRLVGRERAFLRDRGGGRRRGCLTLAFAPDAAWLVVVPLGAVLLARCPCCSARPTTRSSGSPGTPAGSSWPCSCKRFNQTPALAFSLLAAIAASVLAVA